MRNALRGFFTEICTPFAGYRVDYEGFIRLIRRQIEHGADGLVLNSAVGEASALTPDERADAVALARATVGPSVTLIVAAGTNSTETTITEIARAAKAGASAILLRMPYYNRPTQGGLIAHIGAAATASRLPLLLDNDPDRCAVELSVETVAHCAGFKSVAGVLERRGDIARSSLIARACRRDFVRWSASAVMIAAYHHAGGCGTVLSISNIVPKLIFELRQAIETHHFIKAQWLLKQAMPLISALQSEPERPESS